MADKKERDLTRKENKFVKLYMKSGNVSQSALKAGYAFRQSGGQNLSKLVIQHAIDKLAEEQGLTDIKLNSVLLEGLESTKVIGYLHNYKKSKDGKIEKVQPDEIISSEFLDVPDMPTRHRYLETALKIKGRSVEKVELTGKDGESLVLELKIAKPPKKTK